MHAVDPPTGFFHSRRFGLLAALVSFVAVCTYVFAFTPYENFLYSDMKGFWMRAMERLQGDCHSESQYMAWPPLYHVFIAELFRKLQAVGLSGLVRLETLLTLNIALYAGSVFAFQRLCAHMYARPALVAVAVTLQAVGMPALYFNAFLLSDNFTIPIFIISIAVVILGRREWLSLVLGAALFGLAAIVRPAFGPYGLAFVTALLVRHRFGWPFVQRAAVFTAVFFTVVLAGVAEVRHLSEGKVTGLSANGGVDFFLAASRCHRVETNYDGWNFNIIAPSLSLKPENGTYYFDVPFHNQEFYYAKGWEFIRHHPDRIWRSLKFLKELFVARSLPSRPDAPGFETLMPLWDVLKISLFALLGLYVWAWRDLGKTAPLCALLLVPWPIISLLALIYTGEPRYTTQLLFALYLLAFKLICLISLDWRRWTKRLALYAAFLAAASAATAGAVRLLNRPPPPTVAVTVQPAAYTETAAARTFAVGRLLFPYDTEPGLTHTDAGPVATTDPVTLTTRTRLNIDGTADRRLLFEVFSSWPWEMRIDGQPVQIADESVYVQAINIPATLAPGSHLIEATFHYRPKPGGIAITCGSLDRDWIGRTPLGLDADGIRFAQP